MDHERTDTKAALETILRDLQALALLAREAGICITWYEPSELRGLGLDMIEDVMTSAANEFIEFNALLLPCQLSLDLDSPGDARP
jgi:hypothetical protein